MIRGRIARPASETWNLGKTLIQLVAFWGIFLFVIPSLIHAYEHEFGFTLWFQGAAWKVFGLSLFVLGSIFGMISAFTMAMHGDGTPMPTDSTRKLVIVGPYRYVRNPMVLTGTAQAFGVAFWIGSPLWALCVVVGIPVWNFVVRRWEEWDMEERFGDEFRRYRQRVMCWRPRFPGYDPAKEHLEPPISADRIAYWGPAVVLYDSHCALCAGAAGKLSRWSGRRLKLSTMRDPMIYRAWPGLNPEACERGLHLITPSGHVLTGMEAIVRACALRPLGFFAYAYYLPGIRLFFDFWYGFIARHRYRLFGSTLECDEACRKEHAQ